MKLGFIALTDCASIVMAKELGYFAERGLDVSVEKQASWPATRDNLLNGGIRRGQAAQGLLARAMVFQNYSLLPGLSLVANVRQAARAARRGRCSKERTGEVVERYLTAVGLWDHRNKRPAQVSGGMQQRTTVARAFAVGPRLLLLDEPFGALDALTRARLQQQLVELWTQESETEMVLMVTHGIDEAVLLVDRIVVMANPPQPSVVEVLAVPISRPRNRVSVVEEPAYRTIQEQLMRLLSTDAVHAARELASPTCH